MYAISITMFKHFHDGPTVSSRLYTLPGSEERARGAAEKIAKEELPGWQIANVLAAPLICRDMSLAPKDETWIVLYGERHGEPFCEAAFWSEEGENWFTSEAASRPIMWTPYAWSYFE